MLPSFTSLSQRERKRQELLREAERELAIERHLNNRYAETMWAADNEASQIGFPKPTASTETQTETIIPQGSTASVGTATAVNATTSEASADTVVNNSVFDAGQNPRPEPSGLFSEEDRMRVDTALNNAPIPDPLSPISTITDNLMHMNRIKSLFEKYPEMSVMTLHPVLNSMSKKGNTTYYLDNELNLRFVHGRKRVYGQNEKNVRNDIDWAETRQYIEDTLKSKGIMPKDVDTSALGGMVAFLGEPPAPAAVEVDERKLAALSRMDVLYKKQQQQKVFDIKKTYGLKGEWGPPKRPLEDSAVSRIDIKTKRQNILKLSRVGPPNELMINSNGDYHNNVRNLYRLNPWLVKMMIPPSVPNTKKRGTLQLRDHYLDADANVYKMKNPPTASRNDERLADDSKIIWKATFEDLIYYLYSVIEYYNQFPDKIDEHRFRNNLRDVKSTLKYYGFAVDRDEPMQMADLEMKPAAVSGRGLKGAGYVAKNLRDKEGNPIKYHSNRGYNLSQLEGTGTYSSLAYKRIGTKFVHLPKLNENLLKVCYPNRSVIGPRRKISEDLSRLIKTLVFDGDIDQQLYDSMSMDDKRVFHELLRITHTQHALRDPIKDPRDVLKQEYLKLKGEVMLGNDNPSLIRELKQVLVDMYSAKLISDDEFKQVLVAIV